MSNVQLQQLVRAAWDDVPPAPADQLANLEPGWGTATALAFVGVRPMAVDIRSPGFHAATPLFDLPATAASAYLGTFLIALLQSLEFQDSAGLFDDLVTRAHTLTVLTSPQRLGKIAAHLTTEQRSALSAVAGYLAVQQRDALSLDERQVARLREVSTAA